MTIFALLCHVCGLSHSEAADILGVRYDTAKAWAQGKRQASPEVLAELVQLSARIDESASQAIDLIGDQAREHGAPESIQLGVSSSDAEAQSLGWPCVGAHRAVLARTLAKGMRAGYRMEVVPRASIRKAQNSVIN